MEFSTTGADRGGVLIGELQVLVLQVLENSEALRCSEICRRAGIFMDDTIHPYWIGYTILESLISQDRVVVEGANRGKRYRAV